MQRHERSPADRLLRSSLGLAAIASVFVWTVDSDVPARLLRQCAHLAGELAPITHAAQKPWPFSPPRNNNTQAEDAAQSGQSPQSEAERLLREMVALGGDSA